MKILETLHYIGPNRRSDSTCLERHYVLEADESEAFTAALPTLHDKLRDRLAPHGVDYCAPDLADTSENTTAMYAITVTSLALALQRGGGHRVSQSGWLPDDVIGGVWAWFEFEHDQLASPAAELALRLIGDAVPDIQPASDAEAEGEGEPTEFAQFELDEAVRRFVEKAKPLVLPLDTEAIIAAAKRLNIPYEKMERLPFRSPEREIRFQENGYLRLGHGPFKQEVDGTFCVERSDRLLPALIARRASQQHVPMPDSPGNLHRLLLAGGKLLGVITEDAERAADVVHPQTRQSAEQLARQMDAGLIVLHVMTTDISQPLNETGGVVVDVDPAPVLHELLDAQSPLLPQACESFLRWIFPEGQQCRVPIMAVTGTNGKTTTCRMITAIAQKAGRNTGMSCTEGVLIGPEFIGGYRDLGGQAFHHILDRSDVDFAVLEEWFGRICRLGFAYQRSSVAVCTNVTDDHLGRMGAHTLDDAAAVKESVVARGHDAVVLNADDRRCLGMAPRMTAKRICLVSTRQQRTELPIPAEISNPCTCTVERYEGQKWLVIYDTDRQVPIIPVNDIPATFDGAAIHNVSNAAHATAACYMANLPLDSIRDGLKSFAMSFETTPGRLNVYDDLPFRVVMDYAHNQAGFTHILKFMDQLDCAGRRIILVSFTGDRRDEDVVAAVKILAGHFDHYVVRNYSIGRGQALEIIPRLLKQGLLEAGVSENAITVREDANEGMEYALDLAEPGDLLLMLAGTSEFGVIWEKLKSRSRKAETLI